MQLRFLNLAVAASLAATGSAATLRGKESESVAEDSTVGRVLKGNDFLGNGNPNQGPSGCKKVFQFNMLGHPKDAAIPECNNEGKRIFVERTGQNQIPVYVGGVDTDLPAGIPPCQGFDIRCSSLSGMLTNSDYEICVPDIGTFDVTVRILGKPGGELDICVNDLSDVLDGTAPENGTGATECLIGEVNLKRGSDKGGGKVTGGQSKFTVQTSKLFADSNEDVLWGTTTNDFRIAQFTFFEKGCFP